MFFPTLSESISANVGVTTTTRCSLAFEYFVADYARVQAELY